jgi:pimeloyl-ACP methyl ester carboxylesterase
MAAEPFSGGEEQTFAAGGLTWNAGMAGPEGAPTVVFLHGFPEHWRTWTKVMPAIAGAGYRFVAPDLPGYGGTSEPSSYELGRLAEHMAGLFLELDPDGVHLIGHDWGGLVGHAVASAHPETLKSFVAACAPHPGAASEVLRNPAQLLKSYYVGLFQIPYFENLIGSKETIERLTKNHAVTAIDGPDAARRALAYYRTNLAPWKLGSFRAGRIPQPGLVVHAERDVAITHQLMAATAEQFDDLRGFRVLPRNHFLQTEAPEEFARLVLDFLGSVEPPAKTASS